MKQNIFIAALLAGMLALAGCGGGSSSNNSGGNDDKTPPPPPPPTTTKTAGVPNNQVIAGNTAGLSFNLATGELRQIGNYWFRCTGGTCAGSVAAGAVVGTVSYTGTGTLEILASNPTLADSSTANTNQPTESTDPLSNDVLVKALNTQGGTRTAANRTVWNTGAGNAAVTNSTDTVIGSSQSFTPLGGARTNLWIAGVGTNNNAVYYGIWEKSVPDLSTRTPNGRSITERGTVWGGATPYGVKPDDSLDTATYTSTTGGVFLYYSTDGSAANDDWTRLSDGDFTLTANFETGMVGGNISSASLDGLTSRINNQTVNAANSGNDIRLKETSINASGTFSGVADFRNGSRQSGSYNGGFFGPATNVPAGGVQAYASPTHVAGEFSVSRPSIAGATPGAANARQSELHIRGAFGGATP